MAEHTPVTHQLEVTDYELALVGTALFAISGIISGVPNKSTVEMFARLVVVDNGDRCRETIDALAERVPDAIHRLIAAGRLND